MRNPTPYELWLSHLKDVLELKGIDHHVAAESYKFYEAYLYDMTPEETAFDIAAKLAS